MCYPLFYLINIYDNVCLFSNNYLKGSHQQNQGEAFLKATTGGASGCSLGCHKAKHALHYGIENGPRRDKLAYSVFGFSFINDLVCGFLYTHTRTVCLQG